MLIMILTGEPPGFRTLNLLIKSVSRSLQYTKLRINQQKHIDHQNPNLLVKVQ